MEFNNAYNTIIVEALEDNKALDIAVLPVEKLTTQFDTIIVCSATSTQHAKSVANNVATLLKSHHFYLNYNAKQQGDDWILIDCRDTIIHIMLNETREFYGLEKLWQLDICKESASLPWK